jgi:hypothetical protein
MKNVCFFVVLLMLAMTPALAQNNFFNDRPESAVRRSTDLRVIVPDQYRTIGLDVQGLLSFVSTLPAEAAVAGRHGTAPVLELPMPNGTMAKFRVWKTVTMDAALAARFPEIQTFAGQGIDDPFATLKFDYNPYFGFSAQILTINGDVYIDPYARGNTDNCVSYYTRNYTKPNNDFKCLMEESDFPPAQQQRVEAGPCRGSQLLTFRLALACTGEYATRVCLPNPPSVATTLAAMTTSMNRVNGVYEKEVAVRMVMISNTTDVIYLDGNTDPYTNNNGSTMLTENTNNLNTVIGSANFDIGHVFSTGGGGIASLNSPCTGNKARGVTGLTNPVGDAFDIDYVAHEMGHQFGGRHTFNSVTGSCNGNRSATAAYEVGSGTTIQGYAGICGTDNIQPNSDPFFHTMSFDEISTFLSGTGGSCPTASPTGNQLPQITSMSNNNITIPISTPFTLTGSAVDPDGDAVTYNWEEWDLGPAGAWNSGATSTTAPLFKSRIPKNIGSRTFPDMAVILAGFPANPAATMGGLKGETLPTVTRAMKFRLTVRDNRAGGGGVVTGGEGCQAGFTGTFTVNTLATAGPFLVTAPNGGETYGGGSTQTVTWDVANTTAAPISAANVRISLSTDGGNTYTTVLVASTANDGSEPVTIPNIATTTARIKIEAVENIFFDISNANFTISAPVGDFQFSSPAPVNVACAGPNTASVTLATTITAPFASNISLSAGTLPAGTSISFNPQTVAPGGSSIITLNGVNTLPNGTYNVTITGTGGSITRTRVVTFIVDAGAAPVVTQQPGSQTICETGNVTFSVAATGVTAYQWQLSTNGGTTFNDISIGATGSSYTITGVNPTLNGNVYRVRLTGQCNTINSGNATLTVNPRPTVTLAAAPYQKLFPGLTTTLTATINPAPTGFNISWYRNGALIPGVTGTSHTVDVTRLGDYRVDIVNPVTGCNNQSNIVTIGDSASTRLFIYPSPNDGQFIVAYHNPGSTNTQRSITIYDSHGAKVKSIRHIPTNAAYNLVDVNIKPAARGIYYVVLGDVNGKVIAKGSVVVH